MQWRCLRSFRVLPQNVVAQNIALRHNIQTLSKIHIQRQSTATSPVNRVERILSQTQNQEPPNHDSFLSTFTKHATLLEGKGQLDKHVKISGLVRSIRKQKRYAFAHVSDGSTLSPIQAILSPEQAAEITNGSYVELEGKWAASPGQGQSHELQVEQVRRVGESDPEELPLQKKVQSSEFLRSIPHLRLRTPLHSLLSRARSQAVSSVHRFYEETELATFVQPPLITSSDCEGAGEVFTINPRNTLPQARDATTAGQTHTKAYFGEPKYLTVSSQLHLEAYSAELGDVWTMSPTFRAEPSDTPRHLSEFYMLEAEFRGVTDLIEIQSRAKHLIQNITEGITKSRIGNELVEYYSSRHKDDQTTAGVDVTSRWDALRAQAWPSFTYSEVMEALKASNFSLSGRPLFTNKPEWGNGLALEHERWIVENLGKNMPVFVTHYPRTIKPFYMSSSTEDSAAFPGQDDRNDTVACFDLLLPYGTCEVVGGSLREHRLEQLVSNMREKGLLKQQSAPTARDHAEYPYLKPGESLGSLEWYADLRRFGSSPHGGFGLGFDRLLAYLTGVANVRDVVAFPRTWGRADC